MLGPDVCPGCCSSGGSCATRRCWLGLTTRLLLHCCSSRLRLCVRLCCGALSRLNSDRTKGRLLQPCISAKMAW